MFNNIIRLWSNSVFLTTYSTSAADRIIQMCCSYGMCCETKGNYTSFWVQAPLESSSHHRILLGKSSSQCIIILTQMSLLESKIRL